MTSKVQVKIHMLHRDTFGHTSFSQVCSLMFELFVDSFGTSGMVQAWHERNHAELKPSFLIITVNAGEIRYSLAGQPNVYHTSKWVDVGVCHCLVV